MASSARQPLRWPRLLSEQSAAEYLSISATTLRGLGITTRNIGRRVLYDIHDLDRWADRMDEQPIADEAERLKEMQDEERRFLERRASNGRH